MITTAKTNAGAIVDILKVYAPVLKGLSDVHGYLCETLEGIVFDRKTDEVQGLTAAYLLGG